MRLQAARKRTIYFAGANFYVVESIGFSHFEGRKCPVCRRLALNRNLFHGCSIQSLIRQVPFQFCDIFLHLRDLVEMHGFKKIFLILVHLVNIE